MSDITGLSQALATLTGLSASLWGYLLAGVLIVSLIIIMNWAIGGRHGDTFVTFVAALIGMGMGFAFGWLDQWIAIFIIVLLVIVYYGPLRDSLGGGV